MFEFASFALFAPKICRLIITILDWRQCEIYWDWLVSTGSSKVRMTSTGTMVPELVWLSDNGYEIATRFKPTQLYFSPPRFQKLPIENEDRVTKFNR